MTEKMAEQLKDFNDVMYSQNQWDQFKVLSQLKQRSVEQDSSNRDKDQYVVESPFRSSDPTLLNRHKIMGFQKNGDLLRRIKRQLSINTFEKCSDRMSNKVKDRLSTGNNHKDVNVSQRPIIHWQKSQKDEITQRNIKDYEKKVLRLRAQLQGIKQEKNEIRQSLQNQRRFHASQIYSKQLIIGQSQFQIHLLKREIQKHLNIHQQSQQKIRYLQLQNLEYKYKYQLQVSQQQNYEENGPNYQGNDDICNNFTNTVRNKLKNKMFMSLDSEFIRGNKTKQQDPSQSMRLDHSKQIVRYEKQIDNLKKFYENQIQTIRMQRVPLKVKPRNPINILEKFTFTDNFACQSQSHNPQNLKDQFYHNRKPTRKTDECESRFSTKLLQYPNNHKQDQDNDQDIFIPDSIQNEGSQVIIQSSLAPNEQKVQNTKPLQPINKTIPSRRLFNSLTFGGVTTGLLTFVIYRNLIKN